MHAMDSKSELAHCPSTTTGSTAVPGSILDVESGKPQGKREWRFAFWRSAKTSEEPQVDVQDDPYRSITRNLDDCPQGYPEVAAFQSSHRNFLQYRGFSYLHARVLSALQHDVERLEKQLDTLDQWEKEKGDPDKLECKWRDDMQDSPDKIPGEFRKCYKKTRPQVLAELKQKLMEYDEVLLRTKEVSSLQRPSRRDYESVRDWMIDSNPLVAEEQTYIRRKEDIVSLRTGRECAGFDGYVELLLNKLNKSLIKRCHCHFIEWLFRTPELKDKSSNERLHYYAPARVDTLVNVIITIIIFILMILPVVAMWKLSSLPQRNSPFEAIGILIVFTLLFGMAMSGLTKATRQELFGASAAYCAVLVVFISNFGTQTVVMA